jgi:hypothetical protein
LLSRIEDCGSAYLPQVNAFYVREFQMVHAAEDAARFLHQACQGLPQQINGHPAAGLVLSSPDGAADRFYARVIEHAVAYFGSRVLHPSRPAPAPDQTLLTRAACEKAAQAAVRAEEPKFESAALEFGERLGQQIYQAYLSGRVEPRGLRRLFLAHLQEPGVARKVCGAVLSKLRALTRPAAQAAHA